MDHKRLRATRAADHLDMIRGLAAFVVVYTHARSSVLGSISSTTPLLVRPFYLLSLFGYSAVMVFFALSGYLVGGSVVRAISSGRWSWKDYLIARGTRLYLVLVPALLLNVMWDEITLATISGLPASNSGLEPVITAEEIYGRTGLATFFGNLAFLETIVVPYYGSNAALWSLAGEGWYYLIFPMIALALSPQTPGSRRLVYAALALSMLIFIGPQFRMLFPAWLLGVLVSVLPECRWMKSRWAMPLAMIPLLVSCCAIAADKLGDRHGFVISYAVAVPFALLLYTILHNQEQGGSDWYARIAAGLAGCSYTLYLTHSPLLITFWAFVTFDRPWPPDTLHWVYMFLLCFVCLAFAFTVAHFTEARTDQFRKWVVRCLTRRESHSAAAELASRPNVEVSALAGQLEANSR
jgi:peptidoglycan/LPS O-acetylase OafA/YrhL